MQQFYKRLCSATALPVGLDKAEAHARSTAKIIVGSRNSLWGRLAKYPAETLLIDDECHHSNYEARENLRIVQRFQHVVGLSATPWTEGCLKVFGGGEKVFLSLSAAVQQGLVCPFVTDHPHWASDRQDHWARGDDLEIVRACTNGSDRREAAEAP